MRGKIGISRPVDDLGRVVLPAELRRQLGLKTGDLVECFAEEDRIILRFDKACLFCGSKSTLKPFKKRQVCKRCLRELTQQRKPASTMRISLADN